jgi:hypothetical protein
MFRVHEEFPAHPKVEKLESLSKDGASWCGAMGLWLAMGCDCRARLTDGHFTEARMRKVCGNAARYADALVEAKLWHRTPEGYVFHDWADVQETKEQVQSRMAKDRDRKRVGKGAESKTDSERIPDGIPRGVGADSNTPSHPLPSQPKPEGERAPLRVAADPPPPPVDRWSKLWLRWIAVAFGGVPSGSPSGYKTELGGPVWDACEAREPADPPAAFERAAAAYVARCAAKGKPPTLRFLLDDIASWLAKPKPVIEVVPRREPLDLSKAGAAALEAAYREDQANG